MTAEHTPIRISVQPCTGTSRFVPLLRMASSDVTIPYHPTAIRFFEERGVWTAEHDQAQRRLLGAR